jgi:hypothetical protein
MGLKTHLFQSIDLSWSWLIVVDIETYTIICLYLYIYIYPDHPTTRFNIVVSLTPCLYLTPSFHCKSLLYIYTYIHIYYIPIISPLYPYPNSNEFPIAQVSPSGWWPPLPECWNVSIACGGSFRGDRRPAPKRSPRIGRVKMVKGGGVHHHCWA